MMKRLQTMGAQGQRPLAPPLPSPHAAVTTRKETNCVSPSLSLTRSVQLTLYNNNNIHQQQHNNNTTNTNTTMDDHHVADGINIASHVNVSANNPNKLVVDGGELVVLPSNVNCTASGSSMILTNNNGIRGGMNAGLQIYNMNAEEHGRLLAEHIQSLRSASHDNDNYNNNNNNNNNNSDDGDDEENDHHNKANDHMILHPHGLHMGTKLWEQSPSNPSGSDNNTHVLSLLETSTLSGQNHHLGFLQHHHANHHHANHHANHMNIHEDLDLHQQQQHLHPYHHNTVEQGILRPLMNVHESLHTANNTAATGINTASSSSSTTATSTADFMKDGFV